MTTPTAAKPSATRIVVPGPRKDSYQPSASKPPTRRLLPSTMRRQLPCWSITRPEPTDLQPDNTSSEEYHPIATELAMRAAHPKVPMATQRPVDSRVPGGSAGAEPGALSGPSGAAGRGADGDGQSWALSVMPPAPRRLPTRANHTIATRQGAGRVSDRPDDGRLWPPARAPG